MELNLINERKVLVDYFVLWYSVFRADDKIKTFKKQNYCKELIMSFTSHTKKEHKIVVDLFKKLDVAKISNKKQTREGLKHQMQDFKNKLKSAINQLIE